ncbi:MAG: hypothetical protein COU08_00810 [Candidatus Harrisonbacteria bacterium CG10_big_fil_rev_8_21_14_0_10_42_17]|uniref:Band 7 domain-containing protein n=1 Tax=Candidatus Harrisonbacteria bacterium CG10_big_fil_rev_8_21_14_0_10_42_17 TaxID=1974584 RepID=A0A2M6WIR6_9BACT|nr:MAG: hypothetical protein COU08_00810 [Candidatus Harrisonbacteria bacterium CG10_big_fil_rev_8_21_14_0_10_42_17]
MITNFNRSHFRWLTGFTFKVIVPILLVLFVATWFVFSDNLVLGMSFVWSGGFYMIALLIFTFAPVFRFLHDVFGSGGEGSGDDGGVVVFEEDDYKQGRAAYSGIWVVFIALLAVLGILFFLDQQGSLGPFATKLHWRIGGVALLVLLPTWYLVTIAKIIPAPALVVKRRFGNPIERVGTGLQFPFHPVVKLESEPSSLRPLPENTNEDRERFPKEEIFNCPLRQVPKAERADWMIAVNITMSIYSRPINARLVVENYGSLDSHEAKVDIHSTAFAALRAAVVGDKDNPKIYADIVASNRDIAKSVQDAVNESLGPRGYKIESVDILIKAQDVTDAARIRHLGDARGHEAKALKRGTDGLTYQGAILGAVTNAGEALKSVSSDARAAVTEAIAARTAVGKVTADDLEKIIGGLGLTSVLDKVRDNKRKTEKEKGGAS